DAQNRCTPNLRSGRQQPLAAGMDAAVRLQQQLQQALQQAGLDPQLANNPQALQQAIQNAGNLNQQQKQQLQQMAQAQQQACQMCQGLGGAFQQMAQAMQGQGQMGRAARQMAGQLNQMEQLQMLLQQAQAAANQCKEGCQGLGNGLTLQQALQKWTQGGGMGRWGQGEGGKAPIAPTPSGTRMVKADAPVVPGEIIGSTLVDGSPVTGETKAKLREVDAKLAEGYDEAQNEDPLPRRYHETLKHYFGELAKQVEATLATTPEDDATDDGRAGGEEGDADASGSSAESDTDTETESGEDAG
ncbi:MAG: hypothetical protein SYC29_06295, partial [Planctomycetota bacterium]|nr:hypothetical protein [Planctomycetota bacterium]